MTLACQTDKLMSTCVHYGFRAAGKKKMEQNNPLTLAFMHNSFSMVFFFLHTYVWCRLYLCFPEKCILHHTVQWVLSLKEFQY